MTEHWILELLVELIIDMLKNGSMAINKEKKNGTITHIYKCICDGNNKIYGDRKYVKVQNFKNNIMSFFFVFLF